MRAAVAAVEAAQTNPATRTFWWVALGFFDALFAKAITDAASVSRLANRIEHQLKRLMEGSGTVAERMMREALFAVARARPATEHVRNVQEVFRLAGTVPATFELKGEGAPQHPSLRALKELVANAKTAWNKVATGHQSSLATFRDLATQMRARAAELKQQNLVLLGHDIVALAGWIGDAAEKMTDNIAMEVATALLVVENAVETFANLGEEFTQQAGLMHLRLQAIVKGETLQDAAPVPVLDEMSRRAQERLLMAQVVSEIQASLRAIEQALDAFFRDAEKRGDLATLDKPIRQVLGALTMLNEDRAAAALSSCAAEIQRFARGEYVAAQGDFERVARTLSGLGFYVDALQHGKADFDQFMKPISAKKAAAVEEPEAAAAPAGPSRPSSNAARRRSRRLPRNGRNAPRTRLKDELKAQVSALQKDAGLVADAKTEAQAADILEALATADAKPFDPKVSQVLTRSSRHPPHPRPRRRRRSSCRRATRRSTPSCSRSTSRRRARCSPPSTRASGRRAKCRRTSRCLPTIRRGFHTLKGSGRMVGLRGSARRRGGGAGDEPLAGGGARGDAGISSPVAAAREFFEGAVAA